MVINERSRKETSMVLPVPPTFERFQGYNEHRRKKQKTLPLQKHQLQSHSEALFSLCTRPVMRSSPAWEIAYSEIKSLAECLQSYAHYLEFQNDKVKTNQNLNYPVRQVCEDTSVITVKRNVFGVLPEYKLIDKALALVDFNTPVLFDEIFKTHLKTTCNALDFSLIYNSQIILICINTVQVVA